MPDPKNISASLTRKRDPAFQVLIPADDLADYRERAACLGVPLGAVVRDLLARTWPMERGRRRKP